MGLKVLIIDDDPSIRRVAAFALSRAGHEVSQAADGEQGVAMAAAESPDVILLDMRMPGVDGPEACRRLKADPKTSRIPVVFLSASTGPDEEKRCLALGAAGLLPKPFDPASLEAGVARIAKRDENHH